MSGITFDAAGTLFVVREPVGATYGRLARAEGFAVVDQALDDAFRRAVRNAPPLATPASVEKAQREEWVRNWWRRVVRQCLLEATGTADRSMVDQGSFERFFEAAYGYYGQAEAWRLFDDTKAAVGLARARRRRVGVLSNFDNRLLGLLDGLGLGDLFDYVTVSTEVGVAKPERAIFEHARMGLGGLPAEQCLHVGDSLSLDARGAQAAGWQAAWLDRRGAKAAPPGVHRLTSLSELAGLLDPQ